MIRLSASNRGPALAGRFSFLVHLFSYRLNVSSNAVNRKRNVKQNTYNHKKIEVFHHADILLPEYPIPTVGTSRIQPHCDG